MAVGLPVVARPSGQLAPLAPGGIIEAVRPDGADALATTIGRFVTSPARAASLAAAGSAFAAAHTRPAEAARLVARWRSWWPDLPWGR